MTLPISNIRPGATITKATKNTLPTAATAVEKLTTGTKETSRIAGPVILAMITAFNPEGQDANVMESLGYSLENPSFPTEFNRGDFVKWAYMMGFDYEYKDNAAEFKDKETGFVVRRIVQQKKAPEKIDYDRIWIRGENGAEINGYFKKADEPLKYYSAMGVAELHPDGLWYDINGKIMQYNPITNEPQEGYIKVESPLGESLIKPAFPEDFDIREFKAWAKSLGLPAPVIDDGIATFYNWENKIVRQIKELKIKPGKVQEDIIPLYDSNGVKIGELMKWYISSYIFCNYCRGEDGRLQKKAELREDGNWHPFGRDWDDIVPITELPTQLPQVSVPL